MAYDEETAERMRQALGALGDISEKRMMGGVCFLLNGNMIGGADRTKEGFRRFMFRVGKDHHAEALKRPGAMPMDMTGRRMSGFVFVGANDCDDAGLGEWIELAHAFVATLPAK
ncbi:MAG: TfoX/Sxy family protein [Geminicoccaceae bacterium]